jgi:serine/threonine-protein kinase
LPPPDEPAAPATELAPGTRIDGYVIEAHASRGGFGAVYRARAADGTAVAVKALAPAVAGEPKTLLRFRQEADILNRLAHPGIVRVLAVGEIAPHRPYLAMEWLDHGTLDAEIRRRGRLAGTEALAVVEELADALGAAHALGIVHRDIKGSNVMIVPDGAWFHVKLLDFGIAKLTDPGESGITSTGASMGTPQYMAPEQILCRPVDERTDVYSLGVLLFQMLTGQLPFPGRTAIEIQEKHLSAPVPRVSDRAALPRSVDAVLDRALAKSPRQRHPGPRELAADLRRALADAPVAPSVPAPAPAIALLCRVDENVPDSLDLDDALDLVRAEAARLGLATVMDAGDTLVFASALAPDDDPAARRRDVLAGLLAVRQRIIDGVTLVVHAGGMLPGATGGPLLDVESWCGPPRLGELIATTAFLDGLGSVDAVPVGDDRHHVRDLP